MEEFGGARVGTDYRGLAAILDSVGSAPDAAEDEVERLGYLMLEACEGRDVDFSSYSDEVRRAVAMHISITQVAEQDPRRTPGSAAWGRAGYRAVADGKMSFAGLNEAMPFAPAGGTADMRAVAAGERDLGSDEELLAGMMGDDGAL